MQQFVAEALRRFQLRTPFLSPVLSLPPLCSSRCTSCRFRWTCSSCCCTLSMSSRCCRRILLSWLLTSESLTTGSDAAAPSPLASTAAARATKGSVVPLLESAGVSAGPWAASATAGPSVTRVDGGVGEAFSSCLWVREPRSLLPCLSNSSTSSASTHSDDPSAWQTASCSPVLSRQPACSLSSHLASSAADLWRPLPTAGEGSETGAVNCAAASLREEAAAPRTCSSTGAIISPTDFLSAPIAPQRASTASSRRLPSISSCSPMSFSASPARLGMGKPARRDAAEAVLRTVRPTRMYGMALVTHSLWNLSRKLCPCTHIRPTGSTKKRSTSRFIHWDGRAAPCHQRRPSSD
mmetsp:Transcript_8728/g.25159  ORF Transcript_8728/g.25159 Transcript_8728/m.25159 type:complete len:352 (+) Transcript_8728:133-1188(+)